MTIADLKDVHRSFLGPDGGHIWAVNGVSLAIEEGRTVAIIGESGSGKSTLARLLLGLLVPDAGTVQFEGTDLAQLSRRDLRSLRGKMGVVFQEPFEALNPRMQVVDIIAEALTIHQPTLSAATRRDRVLQVMQEVELDPAIADRYPQALSGGQQQRVGIARALILQPRLVVLDEPTSSLDLSVRAQILNLFGKLKESHGLTYLLISHDITTVEYFSDEVVVLYLGHIVERGDAESVLRDPRHPYTKALLSARLTVNPHDKLEHLPLTGDPPSPITRPVGCPLSGRCAYETSACRERPIPLTAVAPTHDAACIHMT